VAKALKDAFERQGVKSQTIHTRPGPGARIVRKEES